MLLAFFVIASAWFAQIVDSSVSGCLAQFLLFSFSFITFTCSASGWAGYIACGGSTQFIFLVVVVVVIFPVLDHSVGQRLPCSEPHTSLVCFLVGSTTI